MIPFRRPKCHAVGHADPRAAAPMERASCRQPLRFPVAAFAAPSLPPVPPPVPAKKLRPLVVVRLGGWLLTGGLAFIVTADSATRRPENVMQACQVAAETCARLVGLYVFARAADFVTRAIDEVSGTKG